MPKLFTPIRSARPSGQGVGSVGTFRPADENGTANMAR